MPRTPTPKPGEPIKLVARNNANVYEVRMTSTPAGAQKRQQVRRWFDTLPAARAFVDETRVAIRNGWFVAADTTTLAELTEAWLATRRDVRAVTVQGYRQAMAGILKAHGSRRVQTITEPEVQRWVDSWKQTGGVRGKGLAHRSIVLSLQALTLVLDYGVKTKIIGANPAAGVKAPRKTAADRAATDSKKTTWTVPQLRAFLAVADQDRMAGAWRLVCCGLRRSEVVGLRWSDLDLETGVASIRQGRVKTGVKMACEIDDPKSAASERDVEVEAIHPGTMALFKIWKTRQAADKLAVGGWDTDLVVVYENGQPINPDTFSARFRSLCLAAGVPVIHMHNTRHTIASLLHEKGVAPAAAAELLGHEVGTHLQFYVKPVKGAKSLAASTLGGLFAASNQ